MPDQSLIRTLLLPELSLVSFKRGRDNRVIEVVATKDPKEEYCPRCATPSSSTYDRRKVKLRDEPFRTFQVFLTVIKRRLWCKPCGKPFTEPLPWARKGFRHTERYARTVMLACERYIDLKRVRDDFKCSGGWLYSALYRQLELERRKRLYPWPTKVGIDEHFFRRGKAGFRDFVTVIVDQNARPADGDQQNRRIAITEHGGWRSERSDEFSRGLFRVVPLRWQRSSGFWA